MILLNLSRNWSWCRKLNPRVHLLMSQVPFLSHNELMGVCSTTIRCSSWCWCCHNCNTCAFTSEYSTASCNQRNGTNYILCGWFRDVCTSVRAWTRILVRVWNIDVYIPPSDINKAIAISWSAGRSLDFGRVCIHACIVCMVLTVAVTWMRCMRA